MSAPTSPPASRRCWPLTIVVATLGACLIVPACLFIAIQLDAGYWFLLRNVAGVSDAQAQGQSPQAGLDDSDATPLPANATAAERGAALFAQESCHSCHSLEPGRTLVGPSLAGVGERAASTVPGETAEAYLRQSIVDPDAHVADGFPAHVMPGNFERKLTPEQIDDLVAYLLTR